VVFILLKIHLRTVLMLILHLVILQAVSYNYTPPLRNVKSVCKAVSNGHPKVLRNTLGLLGVTPNSGIPVLHLNLLASESLFLAA